MADLLRIKVEKQTHPDLTILSPFDIASEYSRLPTEEFRGDSHYALQICIVLHGASELVFEDYSRIYRSGELWWNMCWEPHAYRFVGKRTFVVAVNLDVEHPQVWCSCDEQLTGKHISQCCKQANTLSTFCCNSIYLQCLHSVCLWLLTYSFLTELCFIDCTFLKMPKAFSHLLA